MTTLTGDTINNFIEILRKAALKYELPFIDYLHRMTYDALGNVITDNYGTERYTNLITDDNYSQFIDADTDVTHPTKYGHNVMGKYIGNELHKVMAFVFIRYYKIYLYIYIVYFKYDN